VPVDAHGTGAGRDRAGQHRQQRGLARAVGSHDADRLTGADREVHAGEHLKVTVAFGQSGAGENGLLRLAHAV
jgi:hypothetical protein